MPQEITVVQCYKCNRFQTKIVTISKKWSCVVCNEKQSLKKTFGTGSGKECRLIVQQLNEQLLKRVEQNEQCIEELLDQQHSEATDSSPDEEEQEPQQLLESEYASSHVKPNSNVPMQKNSKWSKYLDDEDEANF